MNFIKKIVVDCVEQQDATGTDDLHFFLNDGFIGRASIDSGEKKEFDGASILAGGGPIIIADGDTFRIEEYDIADPNEILFDHKITQADIDNRSYTATFTKDADYTFTLVFE